MRSYWWKYVAAPMTGALAAVALTATAASAEPQRRSIPAPHQAPAAAVAERCGGSRFSVKTATDPDTGRIERAVVPTTLSSLAALPVPGSLPANNRVRPAETTIFRVRAILDEYALIPADSDYHLILDDQAGHTVIAEIPAPGCVSASSPFKASITRARAEFDARYTPTSNLQTAEVPVTITGVGFFDTLHGQAGVAPNGIELHPVLDVRFGTAARGASAP